MYKVDVRRGSLCIIRYLVVMFYFAKPSIYFWHYHLCICRFNIYLNSYLPKLRFTQLHIINVKLRLQSVLWVLFLYSEPWFRATWHRATCLCAYVWSSWQHNGLMVVLHALRINTERLINRFIPHLYNNN